MDALEFIANYKSYVARIEAISAEKFQPAIDEMYSRDPHDMVSPSSYFNSDAEAVGLVFRYFRLECNKLGLLKLL